jgi:hypothetical protein
VRIVSVIKKYTALVLFFTCMTMSGGIRADTTCAIEPSFDCSQSIGGVEKKYAVIMNCQNWTTALRVLNRPLFTISQFRSVKL